MSTVITWTMSGSSSAIQNLPSQIYSSTAFNFGTDVSCLPDLDRSFALISGNRVLGEAIVRRLTTPRGSLSFHPNYGTDLRQWLRDSMIKKKLSHCAASVENEVLKDERVDSCEAEASYSFDTQTLSIALKVLTANATFKLVLNISDSTLASALS